MKTVVSVSLGSSEYDYELETEFLGQPFRITRMGSDGDMVPGRCHNRLLPGRSGCHRTEYGE